VLTVLILSAFAGSAAADKNSNDIAQIKLVTDGELTIGAKATLPTLISEPEALAVLENARWVDAEGNILPADASFDSEDESYYFVFDIKAEGNGRLNDTKVYFNDSLVCIIAASEENCATNIKYKLSLDAQAAETSGEILGGASGNASGDALGSASGEAFAEASGNASAEASGEIAAAAADDEGGMSPVLIVILALLGLDIITITIIILLIKKYKKG